VSTSCFCSPFLAIVNSEVFSSFFSKSTLTLLRRLTKNAYPILCSLPPTIARPFPFV
jgi:hypothetical protein